MIKVVNKKNHISTEFDIYIGRGSTLGNPYTSIQGTATKAEFVCVSKEESLKSYNEYLQGKIQDKDKNICDELNSIYKKLKSKQNVNLVCYCEPLPCHGHIIRNLVISKFYTHKTYPGKFQGLTHKQRLAFGSNTQGRHKKGMALHALEKCGAKYGQASGLQGDSYAIITKDLTKHVHPSRSPEQIKEEIKKFYEFAKNDIQHGYEYVLPYDLGENLNAYSSKEMAVFFGSFEIPKNIVFQEDFYKLIIQEKYGF